MHFGWSRAYGDAIAPGWLGRLLALCTLLGGIAAVWFFAEKVGMPTSLVVGGIALLVLSILLNVRQAFVWRDAREATVKAERRAVDATRLYEEVEQSGWTGSGLRVPVNHPWGPDRIGDKAGRLVEVSSVLEIRPPYLRFWFSEEVEVDDAERSPSATFKTNFASDKNSESYEVEALEEDPVTVFPDGRVEVRWKQSAVLDRNSRLCLFVCAAVPDKEMRLLSVERRWKVS